MKKLLLLLLLTSPALAADNVWRIDWGATSQFLPCRPIFADDGISTVTGLDGDDINIAIKSDVESTWTDFSTTADIEGGGTIGTYDTPTANTDIVMDECETEGWYEFDLHNDYLSLTNAKEVEILFTDAGGNLVADRVDIIDQNFITPADIQSEAEDAVTAIAAVASGTCETGSSTTTCIDTATRTEGDADYWVNQVVCFTSGNASGQCRLITDFNQTTDTFTFDPATTAAIANTDTYVIWPGSIAFSSICESNGSRNCGDMVAWLGSVLYGECDYDGVDTYTCKDDSGTSNRVVVTYGSDPGDRTDVTLTEP